VRQRSFAAWNFHNCFPFVECSSYVHVVCAELRKSAQDSDTVTALEHNLAESWAFVVRTIAAFEIGRQFGGKHHTTVLHSIHKIVSKPFCCFIQVEPISFGDSVMPACFTKAQLFAPLLRNSELLF
jgi:hypothetical protein